MLFIKSEQRQRNAAKERKSTAFKHLAENCYIFFRSHKLLLSEIRRIWEYASNKHKKCIQFQQIEFIPASLTH